MYKLTNAVKILKYLIIWHTEHRQTTAFKKLRSTCVVILRLLIIML